MTFDAGQIISQFPVFKNAEPPLYYLDNAATSQVPESVLKAMRGHETRHRANVKRGVHRLAEAATQAYEDARAVVARYLGAQGPEEVVFTGGTTAGINLLALSIGRILAPGSEILLSLLEHHSNMVPWQLMARDFGFKVRYLPVTDDGRIDIRNLDRYLTPQTGLVSLCHGSNVTGALAHIPAIVERARACEALFVLDGAQTVIHPPLDLPALGVDFFVFSGHKAYGPNGIGGLWGKSESLATLAPGFGGGEMITRVGVGGSEFADPPHRFEAGTPPIAQAVGLAAALNWVSRQDQQGLREHLDGLTRQAFSGLQDLSQKGYPIRILGPGTGVPRLPLVAFAIDHLHPHDICQILSDRHGVMVRGGNHCAQPLHDGWGLTGSTRASFAAYNSVADVDALLSGLEDCLQLLV